MRRVGTSVHVRVVRVNVDNAGSLPPCACLSDINVGVRIMLRRVLLSDSRTVPEMGIMSYPIPRIDTGGERRW